MTVTAAFLPLVSDNCSYLLCVKEVVVFGEKFDVATFVPVGPDLQWDGSNDVAYS